MLFSQCCHIRGKRTLGGDLQKTENQVSDSQNNLKLLRGLTYFAVVECGTPFFVPWW